MTDISKAKEENPISNGSSTVNTGGQSMNYYDSSKDLDEYMIVGHTLINIADRHFNINTVDEYQELALVERECLLVETPCL